MQESGQDSTPSADPLPAPGARARGRDTFDCETSRYRSESARWKLQRVRRLVPPELSGPAPFSKDCSMRRVLVVVGVVLVSALSLWPYGVHAEQGVSFTFTSFDVPFASATDTKAFSINARGDIVGRYFDGGGPHGFVRSAAGAFTSVDVPVPNTGTVLRGNSANGNMVGKYFDPANPNATHGFLLTADGQFTSFDVPGGVVGTTVAHALNNVGQIVGFYDTLSPVCGGFPQQHGFLRDAGGTFTTIDAPGAFSTHAAGIDDEGTVVGWYFTLPSPLASCKPTEITISLHGFMRTRDGQVLTIDPPASTGALNSGIARINDAGALVGGWATRSITAAEFSADSPIVSGAHSFIVSPDGAFTSFDVLIDGYPGDVLGVNARGTIVGVWNDGHDHGFIGTR